MCKTCGSNVENQKKLILENISGRLFRVEIELHNLDDADQKPEQCPKQLDLSEMFLCNRQHECLEFFGRIIVDLVPHQARYVKLGDSVRKPCIDRGNDRLGKGIARFADLLLGHMVSKFTDRHR